MAVQKLKSRPGIAKAKQSALAMDKAAEQAQAAVVQAEQLNTAELLAAQQSTQPAGMYILHAPKCSSQKSVISMKLFSVLWCRCNRA